MSRTRRESAADRAGCASDPRASGTGRTHASKMYIYVFCDAILASALRLPELPPAATHHAPGLFFRPMLATEARKSEWQLFHQWVLPGGSVWLSFSRGPGGYLLRFNGLADFMVAADLSHIAGYWERRVPVDTVRHLLLDQVVPLVLSAHGRLMLHASAVGIDGRAVAFAGDSGSGKSTLAASLAAHGAPFLTDDCLLLREGQQTVMATGSYPGLRLWPENAAALFPDGRRLPRVAHYMTKVRLQIGGGPGVRSSSSSLPLARLYFLSGPQSERPPALQVTPLSAGEAFRELTRCAFILDINERATRKTSFGQVAWLATHPLFRRLEFQREHSALPRVCEAILDDLPGQ